MPSAEIAIAGKRSRFPATAKRAFRSKGVSMAPRAGLPKNNIFNGLCCQSGAKRNIEAKSVFGALSNRAALSARVRPCVPRRVDIRRGRKAGSQLYALLARRLKFTASFSRFSDGRIAELFIRNRRAGSLAGINASDAAVLFSIAQQNWFPLGIYPNGFLSNSTGQSGGHHNRSFERHRPSDKPTDLPSVKLGWSSAPAGWNRSTCP